MISLGFLFHISLARAPTSIGRRVFLSSATKDRSIDDNTLAAYAHKRVSCAEVYADVQRKYAKRKNQTDSARPETPHGKGKRAAL